MQSWLYFESADRSEALALLRQLQTLPGLASLRYLRLVEYLQIESAYPAETLAPLLVGLGGQLSDTLALNEEMRVILRDESADEEAAMLLRAVGIDAVVTRQTLVILRGIDDVQFRQARDAIGLRTPGVLRAARALPDDAFIGFLNTPTDLLYSRLTDMGLALPESCLSVIADHYRAEGRDPWPDEMLILNEAFLQAMDDPAVSAPAEFITNDARLHTAYADCMAKRRALFPEADAPATLYEMATAATRYLCAHGGRPCPSAQTAAGHPEEVLYALAASGGSPCGGFADAAGETAFLLARAPLPNSPLAIGDRLLLVLPTENTETECFAHALTRFFSTSATAAQIRRSLPVKPGRLIAALGQMLGDTGLGLSLTPPPNGITVTEHLTPTLSGVLLACAPSGGRIIPDALRAQGLRFVLLAEVQKKALITLENATDRLRFPAAMLSPRPALYAEIPAPKSRTDIPSIEVLPALLTVLSSPAQRRSLGADPLTAPTVAQYPATTTLCGSTRLCAATVEPSDDPYGEVCDCALALIARMTAAGAPIETVTLSLTAELPIGDRRDNGRTIAALLALHTVQVELGITATPPVLRAGKSLRITIGAAAPAVSHAQPIPLQENTPLWLIVPRSTEPHLNGERTLLRLATAERNTGRAALIATGMLTPAASAARATVSAGLSLILTAPTDALNTIFPCGVLLAAQAMPALPDGVAAIELGRTQPWNGYAVIYGERTLSAEQLLASLRGDLPAPLMPAYTVSTPPRISAHHYTRPRVLIPHPSTDGAPTALADMVASLGGEPVLCPIDLTSAAAARQSLSAYADLTDSAQILLLSENRAFVSSLLSQRRAVDALSALRARDGLVCAWGEAFAVLLGFGYFSADGKPIPAAARTGERMLCSVFTSTATPWADGIPLGSRETLLLTTDPYCPVLTPETRLALAEAGRVIACAAGTPDGTPAVTALSSSDGSLLGLAMPPSSALLSRGIAYFL